MVYTVFNLLCLDNYPCFTRVKVIDWSKVFGVLGFGLVIKRCFSLLPVILALLLLSVFAIKAITYTSHQALLWFRGSLVQSFTCGSVVKMWFRGTHMV